MPNNNNNNNNNNNKVKVNGLRNQQVKTDRSIPNINRTSKSVIGGKRHTFF